MPRRPTGKPCGRPRIPDGQPLAKSTLKNRKVLFKKVVEAASLGAANRLGVSLEPQLPAQLGQQKSPHVPVAQRKRAPIGTPAVYMDALFRRYNSYTSEKAFIKANGGKGCYVTAVRMLEKTLMSGFPIEMGRQGAMVHPRKAFETYLDLVERADLMHDGSHPINLLMFNDGCQMFSEKKKCHLLSFSLLEAKSPHQRLLQLVIARWVGADDGYRFRQLIYHPLLLPTVVWALARGVNGRPLRLAIFSDWKMVCVTLGSPGPTDQRCCPFCIASKDIFRGQQFARARETVLEDWIESSPVPKLIGLLQSVYDLGHDSMHNWPLVLTHNVIHALYFWVQRHLPSRLAAFVAFLQDEFQGEAPYCIPKSESPAFPKKDDKGDWKLAGKEGKAILYDDTFWDKLDSLFPKYGQPGGCQLDSPYVTGGVAMDNPVHKYLELVRELGLQIMSWGPKNVE